MPLKVHNMLFLKANWSMMAVLVLFPAKTHVCFPEGNITKEPQMTSLTLTISDEHNKSFSFLLFSAGVAVVSFQQIYKTPLWPIMTADCVSLTPLVNCQWIYPNSCGFIVSFECRCSARLLLAQLLPFIHLSSWFIPGNGEPCKVNTPFSRSDCACWTASLALHFTTFARVCATRLIVVSLLCANSSL